MSNFKSAERMRLIILLTLAVVMALASFWVLEVMRKGLNDSLPNLPRKDPDYFVEHFQFLKLTKTGQLHYAISGDRLTHNPQDGTYDMVQPVMKSLSDHLPTTTVRADRSVSTQDNSTIQLYDHVVMDRPASPVSEQFHLQTTYLLALPDEEVMQTDKPVTLLLGATKLNGNGMYMNHATREFRLASNVRGSYAAPQPQ